MDFDDFLLFNALCDDCDRPKSAKPKPQPQRKPGLTPLKDVFGSILAVIALIALIIMNICILF